MLGLSFSVGPEADGLKVGYESFMDFGAGGRDRTGKGFRPTDFRTTSAFAAGPGSDRSWSGLSLRHSPKALDAARLVSTPSRQRRAWLGIAI